MPDEPRILLTLSAHISATLSQAFNSNCLIYHYKNEWLSLFQEKKSSSHTQTLTCQLLSKWRMNTQVYLCARIKNFDSTGPLLCHFRNKGKSILPVGKIIVILWLPNDMKTNLAAIVFPRKTRSPTLRNIF